MFSNSVCKSKIIKEKKNYSTPTQPGRPNKQRHKPADRPDQGASVRWDEFVRTCCFLSFLNPFTPKHEYLDKYNFKSGSA